MGTPPQPFTMEYISLFFLYPCKLGSYKNASKEPSPVYGVVLISIAKVKCQTRKVRTQSDAGWDGEKAEPTGTAWLLSPADLASPLGTVGLTSSGT